MNRIPDDYEPTIWPRPVLRDVTRRPIWDRLSTRVRWVLMWRWQAMFTTMTIAPSPVDVGSPTQAWAKHDAALARVTRKGILPHPWEQRREMVIREKQDTILPEVVPHGFTKPWKPFESAIGRLEEIDQIDRTCGQEIAPEWLTLRANGLRGESLDALKRIGDETYSMKDLVPSDGFIEMSQMLHAHELLGGMRRIEEFLRQIDERQWNSDHPRRYRAVAFDGQVGWLAIHRSIEEAVQKRDTARFHLPTSVEAIEGAMRHRQANLFVARDETGKPTWGYRAGTFGSRADALAKEYYVLLDALDAEREALDAVAVDDFDEEPEPYRPSTACPNEMCEERGDDCVVCQGSKYVLHTLGMDAQADWPPPGWMREQRAYAWRAAPRQAETDMTAIGMASRRD